ncbi:MAG: apolipoprotein N-acyltransferase [Phycisphaerae bacterium]
MPAQSHRRLLALVLLSAGLKTLIFAPIELWLLAFACLVPWLVLIGRTDSAPRVYFHSYLFGVVFFFFNTRWMMPATTEGYVAICFYQAAYFPLVACPVRHAIRRRRWRLAVVFPIVWVGSEMLRAVVISGFPWFFLSHSLYKVLPLIQISDVFGAYGVSFVVAAVNGAVADVVLWRLWERGGLSSAPAGRKPIASVAWVVVLLVATVAYGRIQLGRHTSSPGPRIAIIQGDYLNLIDPEQASGHDRISNREKMQAYLGLIEEAGADRPDLYLLPESPWPMYLNDEARGMFPLSRESFSALQQLSTRSGGYIVTGSGSLERSLLDLLAKNRSYNSATVFYPDGRAPDRYDKIHLVYFGEIVPFRFTRLHFVYRWLNSMMPFSGPDGSYEYSLFRGREFKAFEMHPQSQPDKVYRFGIPICYEDVMPYVSREFVSGASDRKRVDMLLNISNDGWFGRGVQQPQHLAICVFRAVENRVGIARAVNTGVSAFIKPSGRIHDFASDPGDRWPGQVGYSVARIEVDSRYTVYSRCGDFLAWTCAALWLVIFVDYWVIRIRFRREHDGEE